MRCTARFRSLITPEARAVGRKEGGTPEVVRSNVRSYNVCDRPHTRVGEHLRACRPSSTSREILW